MNITMSREEVMSLLEVTHGTFRNMSSKGKINERLAAKGYQLKEVYKQGKNNFYVLGKLEDATWREIQAIYNIKDSNKNGHTKYSLLRLLNIKENRTQLIEDTGGGLAYTTALRYDSILVREGAIKIKNTNTIKQVDTGVKNCVYRMIDKNGEVIYIGKSVGLKSRVRLHATEDKINDWFNMEVDRIEFHQFDEYGDCSIAEIYLITKIKPKYNKEFMSWDISITIEDFENLTWESAEIIETEEYEYEKGENYDKFMGMLRGER